MELVNPSHRPVRQFAHSGAADEQPSLRQTLAGALYRVDFRRPIGDGPSRKPLSDRAPSPQNALLRTPHLIELDVEDVLQSGGNRGLDPFDWYGQSPRGGGVARDDAVGEEVADKRSHEQGIPGRRGGAS